MNGTCTRPQVTYYIIDFNGMAWKESKNNNITIKLPTVKKEGNSTMAVHVSAVNIAGEGPISSFLLHVPSKALPCEYIIITIKILMLYNY